MSAIALDPLIAEAKQRARRRRLLALAAAGILLATVAGVELSRSGSSGTPGTIPWLPTRPNIGAANPPLAPPCTASQLKTTFGMQGLNMYEALGSISLVNTGPMPCSLTGRPHLSFAGAATPLHVSVMRKPAWLAFDPLAPSVGSLRALRPGRHVSVALLVSNPCSADVREHCSGAGGALVFDAPGGGKVRLLDTVGSGGGAFPVSRDEALQATRFTPVVPTGPPSSALPLKARIVAPRPPSTAVKGMRIEDMSFTAKRGTWLSYTVVLTNIGHRPYAFGRTCPAYTESWGGHNAATRAYVLNCHPVGSIAPGQSVPFAMRIYVPRIKLPYGFFGWTLSPHTYNAPTTGGDVKLR